MPTNFATMFRLEPCWTQIERRQVFAAYTIAIATELAEVLSRISTANRHQLVGHVSNLEFWADEVAHALSVIDGYRARFDRLSEAQNKYAIEHQTIEFPPDLAPDDSWRYELPAARPKRIPDTDKRESRRAICDSFYHFVVRCHNGGLLDESQLRAYCKRLDIGVETRDLKRKEG